MECVFGTLCLYLFSILIYNILVFIFVKPYYRNIILLDSGAAIDDNKSLSQRNKVKLDKFMYENYYCYGFIYPLFIVVKILKALWFLIIGKEIPKTSKEIPKTSKDIDYKPHHW